MWEEARPARAWAAPLLHTLRNPRACLPRMGLADAFEAYKRDATGCASGDLGAGVVVGVMLIPQALAYAQLAGMPPVTGFYAAILALFLYPLLGSSGYQAVGPVALLSLMSFSAVEAVAGTGAPAGIAEGSAAAAAATHARFVALSAKLAFLIGILQLGLGLARAGGLIMAFLSHPVLAGFTFASAVVIASSQLPGALGISVSQASVVWETWRDVARALPRASWPTLLLFSANLAAFYGLTFLRQRALAHPRVKAHPVALGMPLRVVSVALVLVAVNTAVAWGAGLEKRGIKVLGAVPAGLPQWAPGAVFDATFGADAVLLLPSAVLIAVIAFVESASVARAMQARYGATPPSRGVDGDRELLGLGAACLGSALCGGFPVTGGFSRSGVNAEAGAKTVVAGLVTGALLLLVVRFATGLFYFLPSAVLSAMIVFSALRLMELDTPRYLWAVDKGDALAWLVTVTATLAAGVDIGLAAGAGLSLLRTLAQAAQPHTAALGLMPDGHTYRNLLRFPGAAAPVPGLAVLRLDGPLFFANVGVFTARVLATAFPDDFGAGGGAGVGAVGGCLRAVLLDFSGVSAVDSSGLHALVDTLPAALAQRAAAAGAGCPAPLLFIVAAHGPVRDRLAAGEAALAAAHHRAAAAAAQRPGPVTRVAALLRCGGRGGGSGAHRQLPADVHAAPVHGAVAPPHQPASPTHPVSLPRAPAPSTDAATFLAGRFFVQDVPLQPEAPQLPTVPEGDDSEAGEQGQGAPFEAGHGAELHICTDTAPLPNARPGAAEGDTDGEREKTLQSVCADSPHPAPTCVSMPVGMLVAATARPRPVGSTALSSGLSSSNGVGGGGSSSISGGGCGVDALVARVLAEPCLAGQLLRQVDLPQAVEAVLALLAQRDALAGAGAAALQQGGAGEAAEGTGS